MVGICKKISRMVRICKKISRGCKCIMISIMLKYCCIEKELEEYMPEISREYL